MRTKIQMTNLFCPQINNYCKGVDCIACEKMFDFEENEYEDVVFCTECGKEASGNNHVVCNRMNPFMDYGGFPTEIRQIKKDNEYNENMYICSIFDQEEKDKILFNEKCKVEEKIQKAQRHIK